MKRKIDRDLTNLPPPMTASSVAVAAASASFVVVASAILLLADEFSGGVVVCVLCSRFPNPQRDSNCELHTYQVSA